MAAIAHAMGAVLDERIMKGGDPIASFCGLLRAFVGFCKILRPFAGICDLVESVLCEAQGTWKGMETHGRAWTSMEGHGRAWMGMEWHGRAWNATVLHVRKEGVSA